MAGVAAVFADGHVFDKNGNQVDLKSKLAGKTVGIYFSAHWCPPCRGFTPILAKFYNTYHNDKNFEIIFVSADSDETSFKEYYGEMPWLSLSYNDSDVNEKLNGKFQVEGIPMLVLLNGDSGELITNEGREKLQFEDNDGANFPWKS